MDISWRPHLTILAEEGRGLQSCAHAPFTFLYTSCVIANKHWNTEIETLARNSIYP
jgi:hypothetical protein